MSLTALANGTYTISSLVGSDIFYLQFRDSAPGSRLRGRPYSGDDSQHWEIRTSELPNQYTILNALYRVHVTYPQAPPAEGEFPTLESGSAPQKWFIFSSQNGYTISDNANRTSVWNIAGGAIVDHANIILYDYHEFAENELWNIVPRGSNTTSEGPATVTVFKPLTRLAPRTSTSSALQSPSPPTDTASNETEISGALAVRGWGFTMVLSVVISILYTAMGPIVV
ncbi:hypothetical protein CC1G_06989 [Coprinopsis cinerea okayama7|uniref:Ricin B lectin domain-containing protein n=1 Tax=Coprinopsis cinerea (strain Okayama-7 / 130 / ATCC MYA-4618 / FGSC 9003) TaxID=240176 RepID=A8NAT6_COPC7|nr:hypothetical protein CC1G_06989 [Coprinopsis cinerea okayama7\|eukprot:XP_001831938.2 hypothetical protein CC1G_06989 [Coprinopsis cinerea okayama7\